MAKAVVRVPATAIEMSGSRFEGINDVWSRCYRDHNAMPVFQLRGQLFVYYRDHAWVMTDTSPLDESNHHAVGILQCPKDAVSAERMDALEDGTWEFEPQPIGHSKVQIVVVSPSEKGAPPSIHVMGSHQHDHADVQFYNFHPNIDGIYTYSDGGFVNRELGICVDGSAKRFSTFKYIGDPPGQYILLQSKDPSERWSADTLHDGQWRYSRPKAPDPCRTKVLRKAP